MMKQGGIYFLYKNKKLIYIGKTIDIDKRLFQHSAGNWCYSPKEFDFVLFDAIKDKSKIAESEKILIKKFKPMFNGRNNYYQSKENIQEPTIEEIIDDFNRIKW